LKSERYDEAVAMLLQAEKMDPFIEKINMYLGEAYFKMGDQSKACASYRKSFERKEIEEKYYKVFCK
jgi:DNA-binding SARP family transcriptional activator